MTDDDNSILADEVMTVHFVRQYIQSGRSLPQHILDSARPHARRNMVGDIWLTLAAEIAAWRAPETVEVKYPEDWWQAFKQRWAPGWFLRRWPVQYHHKVYCAAAFLPNCPIPEHGLGTLRYDGFIEDPVEDECDD